MKFVFFGYDFSLPVLQRLLDDGHELVSLFTFECDNVFNFNREIIKRAQNLNAPFTMAKPTAKDIEYFTAQGAEFFLSCGYPYKIPSIDESKAYGINTHPSLLPRGRGLMPSPHILMHELEVAGFTVHKLTPEYDAGDILYQEAITLTNKDTVDSYSAEIGRRTPEAISKVVADLPKSWDEAKPQDQSLASTFPAPTEQDRTLDWNDTIEKIDLIGRAFGSFGCLAPLQGKKIAIFAYEVEKQEHSAKPGDVVNKTNDQLTIAAADGIITLTKFMVLENT